MHFRANMVQCSLRRSAISTVAEHFAPFDCAFKTRTRKVYGFIRVVTVQLQCTFELFQIVDALLASVLLLTAQEPTVRKTCSGARSHHTCKHDCASPLGQHTLHACVPVKLCGVRCPLTERKIRKARPAFAFAAHTVPTEHRSATPRAPVTEYPDCRLTLQVCTPKTQLCFLLLEAAPPGFNVVAEHAMLAPTPEKLNVFFNLFFLFLSLHSGKPASKDSFGQATRVSSADSAQRSKVVTRFRASVMPFNIIPACTHRNAPELERKPQFTNQVIAAHHNAQVLVIYVPLVKSVRLHTVALMSLRAHHCFQF